MSTPSVNEKFDDAEKQSACAPSSSCATEADGPWSAEQQQVTLQQIPIADFEDPNLDPNAEFLGALSCSTVIECILIGSLTW
jgi:hypothetical protein